MALHECKYCDTLITSASTDYFDLDDSGIGHEDEAATFPEFTDRKRKIVKLVRLQMERAR